jgi:hypothetical protein
LVNIKSPSATDTKTKGVSYEAGDTAQSISKDSLFRFANAQALFYSRFSDPALVRRKQVEVIPELLPLSHNYRSHLGILSVASVVMELLYAGTNSFRNLLSSSHTPNRVSAVCRPITA